jgi:hypothetical protein
MASLSKAWGDGTGEALTATYGGAPGAGSLTLASPPNGAPVARAVTLALAGTVGGASATLSVTQAAMSGDLLLATETDGVYILDGSSYIEVGN